jgi:hypothetical protein
LFTVPFPAMMLREGISIQDKMAPIGLAWPTRKPIIDNNELRR